MNNIKYESVEKNLHFIVAEMELQVLAVNDYYNSGLTLEEEIRQIREFIDVGECDLAYQSIIANLQSAPFLLSGNSSIKLLEVALKMKFKTDRDEDVEFDFR